jgi:hypothetical protein
MLHLIQIWRISYISANFLFDYGKPISDEFEETFFVSEPVLAATFTLFERSRSSAISHLFYFPWNTKFIVESKWMKSLYVIHLQQLYTFTTAVHNYFSYDELEQILILYSDKYSM